VQRFHSTRPTILHNPIPAVAMALLLALLATLLIEHFQLDLKLAHWLYRLQGERWALKDQWLFSELLHRQGRHASIALLLIFLGLLLASFRHAGLKRYRRLWVYLVVAPLSASALVLLGKQTTGIPCPWDLQPFGGQLPYLPLSRQLLSRGDGACFPAGHASAGYAWLALYFAALAVAPRWRFHLLGLALGLGLLFGITQQLRGAHLLSHDLWSLTLCWCSCALLSPMLLRRTGVCRACSGGPIMEHNT